MASDTFSSNRKTYLIWGGITMLFVGYFKHRYRESSAIKTFTVNRNQKKLYIEDVLPNEIF